MTFHCLLPRVLAAAVCALAASPALGRIKLITLPVRERVEIQLDHDSATLVEEERVVPLVKGENQVDFSWANTQIDPNTIVFRVIGPAGGGGGGGASSGGGAATQSTQPAQPATQPPTQSADARAIDAKVLSVSYPPNESALVWAVGASNSGSARVRISYLLGNLSKTFHYRAVATRDESKLTLAQYIRLQNFANEEFASTNLWAGFGRAFLKPVGLNETKEMLMSRTADVPVRKTYTCDAQAFGHLDEPQKKLRVPMHYVIRNDRASRLGTAPLRDGKVRIFITSGGGGGGGVGASGGAGGGAGGARQDASTAFLGEDWGKFTPVDDEMKLYLGVAQDIVVKRTIERNESRRLGGNLHDYDVIVKFEIENRKAQAVTLDVAENLKHLRAELGHANDRDVQWELGDQSDLRDADVDKGAHDKLLFHVPLPARGADGKAETIVKKLHVILRNEWQ
ncbi:MAG TPA: hypothetical protein VER17_05325 [Tepidisphaeraceae bacterium]|nr:hypothetical protein [Tepidisphaeraceae bacterium]